MERNKNNMIIRKRVIIVFSLLIFIGAIIYISYSSTGYMIGLMLGNTKNHYSFEYVKNPNNSSEITLMLAITNIGVGHYNSNIYIIPGEYNKKEVPNDGNYIKLSDGAGLSYKWQADSNKSFENNSSYGSKPTLEIFTDGEPELNNYYSSAENVVVKIDEAMFERFRKDGVKVRRYELFNAK